MHSAGVNLCLLPQMFTLHHKKFAAFVFSLVLQRFGSVLYCSVCVKACVAVFVFRLVLQCLCSGLCCSVCVQACVAVFVFRLLMQCLGTGSLSRQDRVP